MSRPLKTSSDSRDTGDSPTTGRAGPAGASNTRRGPQRAPAESPRSPEPKRLEKARLTRERLFQAATEIVGEEGYAETSIAKITARAKVALGTFYNYFDSRQDLLDQLLPTLGQDLLAVIRLRVAKIDNPQTRERARLQAFFDYLVSNPHFYRILNEAEMFAPRGFQQHMQNMAAGYQRALKHEAKRGRLQPYTKQELEAVTFILLAARNYLSMRYSYVRGRVRRVPQAVIDAYMKLITEGLFK